MPCLGNLPSYFCVCLILQVCSMPCSTLFLLFVSSIHKILHIKSKPKAWRRFYRSLPSLLSVGITLNTSLYLHERPWCRRRAWVMLSWRSTKVSSHRSSDPPVMSLYCSRLTRTPMAGQISKDRWAEWDGNPSSVLPSVEHNPFSAPPQPPR